ncbi:unnamed protein product [Closterium sp. NIES-64]|nr:unnamed protein product [Closterium sp. NIES-64]
MNVPPQSASFRGGMEVAGPRRAGVRRVEEGDRVVVYEARDAMRIATVTPSRSLQNRSDPPWRAKGGGRGGGGGGVGGGDALGGGTREGGAREGGAREGGAREGGAREGGAREGGAREVVAREGGARSVVQGRMASGRVVQGRMASGRVARGRVVQGRVAHGGLAYVRVARVGWRTWGWRTWGWREGGWCRSGETWPWGKGQLAGPVFGVFRHSEWVGQPVGSRVRAAKGGGFVHLLAPSPALWTKVLPHRTQILYLPDIALIIARLAVTPGATVLESGTGSGSLSHSPRPRRGAHRPPALLRLPPRPCGESPGRGAQHMAGEEDEERGACHMAWAGWGEHERRAEFEANGIAGVASVQVRDIQGLGFPPHLHASAHAAFLDLPCPWLALPSAAACLLPGGRLCSFSPCMEQVQRCSQAMRAHGLTDIRTVELLSRSYEVREEVLTVPTLKRASEAPSLEPPGEGENGRASEGDGGHQSDNRAAKRRREEGGGEEDGGMEQSTVVEGRQDGGATGEAGAVGRGRREMGRRQRRVVESMGEERRYVAARPVAESKGHTGYLTFAIKPV